MSSPTYQDLVGAMAACTIWLLDNSIDEEDEQKPAVRGDAWRMTLHIPIFDRRAIFSPIKPKNQKCFGGTEGVHLLFDGNR